MPTHAVPASPPPPPHHRSRHCRGDEPRFRRCVRKFFAHLFSNLGLFGLVAGYVIVGAFVFRFLEAGNERMERDRIGRLKNDCLGELWNITVRMQVLHEVNWTKLVYEPLHKFETQIMSTQNIHGYDNKNTEQWSLTGALLYSVTVITTIGYGNLAPKTPEGKIVTMVYALFGVPLMLLCISNLGSLLAGTFQFAYSHSCCSSKRKPGDDRREKSTKKSTSAAPALRSPTPPPPPVQQFSSSETRRAGDDADARSRKPRATGSGGGRPPPVYRLTSEAKHVLCECAEYQLANSPTHDHVAAHILRQLGDVPAKSSRDVFACETDTGEDDQCQTDGARGTPSRVPLIAAADRQQQQQQQQHRLRRQEVERCGRRGTTNKRTTAASKRRNNAAPSGVPVTLVLLVLLGYICLGAAVFAAWEGWSFIDGAYFCFVTLSTIGFGDLVPGKSFQGTDTQNGQLQLVACCGYLLFGLVLIAMSFSLVQEEVASRCRHVARNVGLLKQSPPAAQPYAL